MSRQRRYRGPRDRRNRKPRDICPVCTKPISFIPTTITHRESGKRAHFDCVVKELKKYHQLNPKEDICYLGSGTFGVVEKKNKKGKGGGNFVVKKRIPYEEKD
jgi:hypothetical protein